MADQLARDLLAEKDGELATGDRLEVGNAHQHVEYSKRYPALKIRLDVPQLDTPAGFVVRKGNDHLREAINKALHSAIDDGTYKKIFVKWFPDAPLPERFR